MFRTLIEIVLVVCIIYLSFLISSGAFCHCSTVQCPDFNPLRSYLS